MYGKQNKWCFVPCCTSTSVSTPNKIFVTVPQNLMQKRRWFKAARRDMPKSKTIFFCCEDHFNLEEDMENYTRFKLMGGNIFMKPDVVPHIFICQPDRKTVTHIPERSLPMKRKRKEIIEQALTTEEEKYSDQLPIISDAPSTSALSIPWIEEQIDDVSQQQRTVGTQFSFRPSFRSKYVQCQLKPTVVHSALSPLQVLQKDTATSPHVKLEVLKKALFELSSSSETGEMTSSSFAPSTACSDLGIVEADERKEEQVRALNTTRAFIEKASKYYLGVPDPWLQQLLSLLSLKTKTSQNNIMLTLMKIKLNDSILRLGHMFGMSTSNASKIFLKTLTKIESYLSTLVFWPPSDKIKYFMPISFRARYSNVQSIIDCLEIEIEKPTDPVKQALTWSEYKKCNTLKYLVSSAPDGFINFISKGYGGRISDSLLVQTSGYLSVVPNGSSVMADRRFKDIGKYLHNLNCDLVRPPSVSSSVKPTRAEVMESKRVASLRIHIERDIRRIREFQYLKPHSVINHNLIVHTDAVIKVACALINLQNPIIKQE